MKAKDYIVEHEDELRQAAAHGMRKGADMIEPRRNGKAYPADEYTLEGYKTHGPCEDCGIQMNDQDHALDTSASRRGAGAGTGVGTGALGSNGPDSPGICLGGVLGVPIGPVCLVVGAGLVSIPSLPAIGT